MRRHISLSLALIFGLVAALSATPLLAMQVQGSDECLASASEAEKLGFSIDCKSKFSTGLTVTPTSEGGLPYRFYDVKFAGESGEQGGSPEAGAYIPERFNQEALVVEVLDGIFAFRVQGPGVVVALQSPTLETFTASPAIGLGISPNDTGPGRTYTPGPDYACNLTLPDGRTACLLEPTDFAQGDTFVRLEPGDTVYLPSNSTCFLCNTAQIDANGNEVSSGGNPAELQIWSSTAGFNGSLENPQIAAVDPQQDQLHSTSAWMFNPGSRCN